MIQYRVVNKGSGSAFRRTRSKLESERLGHNEVKRLADRYPEMTEELRIKIMNELEN